MSSRFMSRLILVALLVCAPVFGAPAPVILVMGDSVSAGYGIDLEQGWVSLLADRLAQQGYTYHVVNASVSGETTAGGLDRLPAALKAHNPAIVILELGGNDGLRGLSLVSMKENLDRMIGQARRAGAKVLLIGMRLPPNYGPAYTDKFAAVYVTLARQHNVPLVPFLLEGVAENRALMQADGIHPLAAAEPRLLDNVWRQLKPLLRRGASRDSASVQLTGVGWRP